MEIFHEFSIIKIVGITRITALIIAIVSVLIVPTSSNNIPNNNNEKHNIFVQVIGGNNEQLAGQTLAAEWIIQATAQLGSPYAWEHTDWIEVTENKQEIYRTMMGGRLIEVRLLPQETQDKVTVEITGFAIGSVPRKVILKCRNGVTKLIKLTNYPGDRNVFLGIKISQVANPQD
ncbi:MAG: hypothetical protein AB4062_18135 [Crocosphaera sp.]